MGHQAQYWITCPACEHQMEVRKEGGPLRTKYCERCHVLFCFTNEELAVAESIAVVMAVGAC